MVIRSLLSLLFPQLKNPVLSTSHIKFSSPWGPSLMLPCSVCVLLNVLKFGAVYQAWPNKMWAECSNYEPCDVVANTVTDMVCLHYCKDTLVVHIQLTVHQHLQILSSRAAPQPVSPQPVLLIRIISSLLQDFTFIIVKSHVIPFGMIF